MTIEEENIELRKMVGLSHYSKHSVMYLDDGEIQCGICMVDFKRDPLELIQERLKTQNIKHLDSLIEELKKDLKK